MDQDLTSRQLELDLRTVFAPAFPAWLPAQLRVQNENRPANGAPLPLPAIVFTAHTKGDHLPVKIGGIYGSDIELMISARVDGNSPTSAQACGALARTADATFRSCGAALMALGHWTMLAKVNPTGEDRSIDGTTTVVDLTYELVGLLAVPTFDSDDFTFDSTQATFGA